MQQSVSKARHCSAGHKSATKPSSPPQSGRTYHPLSLPAGASDCREYALGKIRAIQGAVLTWINIPGSAPTLPISLVCVMPSMQSCAATPLGVARMMMRPASLRNQRLWSQKSLARHLVIYFIRALALSNATKTWEVATGVHQRSTASRGRVNSSSR